MRAAGESHQESTWALFQKLAHPFRNNGHGVSGLGDRVLKAVVLIRLQLQGAQLVRCRSHQSATSRVSKT